MNERELYSVVSRVVAEARVHMKPEHPATFDARARSRSTPQRGRRLFRPADAEQIAQIYAKIS